MNTTLTSRIGAAIAVTSMSTAALLSVGAPAFAAPAPGAVTANADGAPLESGLVNASGGGYNNVIDGQSANTFLVKIEGGTTVQAYCIQRGVKFDNNPKTVYSAVSYADSGVKNVGRAASIAVQTGGTPLADKNAEIVARQLAIWSYTDATNYSSVKNAAIVARADALKASASDLKGASTSFVLKAAVARAGSKDTVTATLTTGTGTPVANQALTLTGLGAEQKLTTDAKGAASVTVDSPKAETKVSFTWNGVLPAGSVLVPSTGGQKVVTTTDAPIVRTAAATVAAAPAPTPTPTVAAPSPTPTPEPTVAAPPAEPVAKKELPYTGTSVSTPMVLGALGLVGFGAWSRRRRPSSKK